METTAAYLESHGAHITFKAGLPYTTAVCRFGGDPRLHTLDISAWTIEDAKAWLTMTAEKERTHTMALNWRAVAAELAEEAQRHSKLATERLQMDLPHEACAHMAAGLTCRSIELAVKAGFVHSNAGRVPNDDAPEWP